VILSDASEKAYGYVAYIRWRLKDGRFWSKFIIAKSRVAPMKRLTTPQLELNAAVLAKRGRETIQKEMHFPFKKVHHFVASATVLGMLNKFSTRFRL